MRGCRGAGAAGRDESGSVLLIALFFVTVFSVFVATVITFADVGLRASRSFGLRGQSTYAADAALQAAMERYGSTGPCDDFAAPLDPDGKPVGGQRIIVRCEGPPPGGDRANRPLNALLSLGTNPAEDGIATSAPLHVLGSVYSNSTVRAGATMVVQGRVDAPGDCTPPASVRTDPAGEVHCANTGGNADTSRGRDPDYTKERSTVPVHRDVPGCPTSPAWLVALEPGYYDDAGALSALTGGTCPNVVVWFKPGFHYLDFSFRGGAAAWNVNDPTVDVVGGLPKGWNPVAATRPSAAQLKIPGACRTEADGTPTDGVQLVVGGRSRLRIDRGQVELCARPNPVDQSIALYGMAPARPTHDLMPTAVTTVVGFTDPANAVAIDETPAPAVSTAALASSGATSAQLVVRGFRPGVPPGSVVDTVRLRVKHKETGDIVSGGITVAATFPGAAGGTCTPPGGLPRRAVLTEDTVDLKADCTLDDPAALADLSLAFGVNLAAGGTAATEELDGIALEVAYRVPTTLRPTAVASGTVVGFADPANALEVGEQPSPLTADATLAGGTPSASLTVAGLGDPPIPAGSTIDSARLLVAHRDAGDAAAPTVTVPFAGGTCTALPLPASPTAVVEHRVDLKACGLNDPARLAGLTATYDVALGPGGTAGTSSLDGMWLELVYTPPPRTRPPVTVTPGPFTNPDNAKVVGESPTPLTADAALSPGSPSATLLFTGYDQPALPAGAFIESAVLRVVHHDQGDQVAPTLTVTVPAGTCVIPAPLLRPTAPEEDPFDITACLPDPAQLAGLTVAYRADLAPGGTAGTARVDGVVLDLSWRPPAIRRPAAATAAGFANPDNAKVVGESPTPLTADAALGAGAGSASITLGGFGQLPIPAGSAVDSAKLRVVHHEDGPVGPVTLTASSPGGTCGPATLANQAGGLGADRVDVKACAGSAAQLAGLSATYTVSLPPPSSLQHSATAVGSSSGFTDPDQARDVDGLSAQAVLSPVATSALITLTGYDPAAVPAGSEVTSAVLRVFHVDSGDIGPIDVAAPFVGSSCGPQAIPSSNGAVQVDTVDLGACGLTTKAQLAGLDVSYAVSLAAGGAVASTRVDGIVLELSYRAPATDRLDGIELEIVYRAPTFTPLGGCVTAGPYPGGTPDPGSAADPAVCALVRVSPAADPAARFSVAGTVYAPTAALDIAMSDVASQVFTRGLVARTIHLGISPTPANRRPTVGIPPESVVFTAYPDGNIGPANATSAGFATPGEARALDGTDAIATINTSVATSASLDVDSFGPAPPGTSVAALVLRVAHREEAGIGSVTVTVSLNGTPCASQSLPLHVGTAAVEDQVDLVACGVTLPADVADLAVTYTVGLAAPPPPLPATVRAYLDGITLDALANPLLRARVTFDRGAATVQGWSSQR